MKKIVLLTDTLTPYRHPFFTELAVQAKKEKIDFKILVMQADVSYRSWKYSDFQQDYAQLLKRKVLFGKADRLYINSDLRLCLDELKPDILVLSGGVSITTRMAGPVLGKTQTLQTFLLVGISLERNKRLQSFYLLDS